MSVEIGAEYASSLADLTVNSKPLINMLTILAEENQEHAGVIVNAVENHLEKVRPDIKLPVLYLVDSIIKNVGGAYTQKFSQIIVNMFTKTFKQVDEKTRSQMFKLRETWNDVFPANKMYQLDVKVSLIDPAWPIQAQVPLPANSAPVIHLNPHFQKKGAVLPAVKAGAAQSEEDMMSVLARKQQELLLLQQKKIEIQLEATRRQLTQSQRQDVPIATAVVPPTLPPLLVEPPSAKVPVHQRLGPPVTSRAGPSAGGARIAPVSGAMLASARRADPRLARHMQSAPVQPLVTEHAPASSVATDIFDIKPLERSERIIKRNNVMTINVQAAKGDSRARDTRELRRRDPRLKKRPRDDRRADNVRGEKERSSESDAKAHKKNFVTKSMHSFPVVDAKQVNKLPPIPRIKKMSSTPEPVEDAAEASPPKRKKETQDSPRQKKPRRKDCKEASASPEKPSRNGPNVRPRDIKPLEPSEAKVEPAPEPEEMKELEHQEDDEAVAFKELRNSTRERNYMRRNREKSESPEPTPASAPPAPTPASAPPAPAPASPAPAIEADAPTVPDILMDENKDVDLRVLANPLTAPEPTPIRNKRPSTESDGKPVKKNKMEKFDILFGDEDVDLRKLPLMDETPAPPVITVAKETEDILEPPASPDGSPRRKSWAKIKDPKLKSPDDGKSQLDLVRAKLAEATKGKDRLGRPLLYSKEDPSGERRRTISSSEDTDMRYVGIEDSDNDRESIKIIMSQAEEQLKFGNLNLEQFNLLVRQVLQLNERQKLKEAKQRESLEASKRKLQKLSTLTSDDEMDSPKKDGASSFGDIDERVLPPRMPKPEAVNNLSPTYDDYRKLPSRKPKPETANNMSPTHNVASAMDSDLRVPPIGQYTDSGYVPHPPPRPLLMTPGLKPYSGGFPRSDRSWPLRGDDFGGPRALRARLPAPGFRGRVSFDRPPPRMSIPRMPPPPMIGMYQGGCPLLPYLRSTSPPPLGTMDLEVPPTDFALVEYIERDPMKSIDIDGVPREIRFYGRTAIVMMDWDDPREITFLPGRRRITFDGQDSLVLSFNEEDTRVNVNGQALKVGFGNPTRELYIDDKWYECFFGGPPAGLIVNGVVMLVHLAGPPPQVNIGKVKRQDIVAGKINLIVDAVTMCPVFLDAKPQKVEFEGQVLTVRFVDSLQTVLINEKPFKVEYGGLPKPIIINNNKHFIRFSVLPRNIRPGHVAIANMDGNIPQLHPSKIPSKSEEDAAVKQDTDAENSNQGLDMLASLMPSSMAPASQFSGYSVAEPLKPTNSNQIPGLDTPTVENPPATGLPFFGSINVNDLFAKLVATGIVQPTQTEAKEERREEKQAAVEKPLPKHDKKISKVDLMKPQTLRVKQSGVVALLYSGMQCSGCGARFPPEQTVRYSQHLDWHFRQNRRERDSARRAHSRNWHYDLSDWIQYEEIEDLEEREKSWFESQGSGEGTEASVEASQTSGAEHEALSVAAGAPADASCALCGDKFDQFYNEDKEEWHLRKAVRHEDKNYHPLCFEDYKASLSKEEAPLEDSVIIVNTSDGKTEGAAGMEAADPDVEEVIPSDDEESVVEVVESESQSELTSQDGEAPTTIVDDEEPPAADTAAPSVESEGEDDDVVLKQDPVVQVDVQDDSDTDDETAAARAERDERYHFANVKIKQEPIDPDDEPVVTAEAEPVHTRVDTTHTAVTSSIDGNVQLETPTSAPTLPAGGIRINITKQPVQPPPSPPSEDSHVAEDSSDEPLPPGEEPPLEYVLKPTLQNVEFEVQPPVERGIELSGLCSIM